ncbi:hypothetical protein H9Q08_17275 [Chryseobacterium sp. PS-8]|uniref:Bacteriocin n=1 Tax=Chryseobacterium indicum TaxID=2766954 RepID=A0ABS9C9S1_9FLAO|nr:hypothetical protein [Chryseobacterium sp. PS-8]MCF2221040.1 hypothetical protein [Chryseobacterium sp. PS-8]
MKKQKQTEKKLSLKKLQMAKITTGLNSIYGGSAVGGNGGNDTILDNTDQGDGNVSGIKFKTSLGFN